MYNPSMHSNSLVTATATSKTLRTYARYDKKWGYRNMRHWELKKANRLERRNARNDIAQSLDILAADDVDCAVMLETWYECPCFSCANVRHSEALLDHYYIITEENEAREIAEFYADYPEFDEVTN